MIKEAEVMGVNIIEMRLDYLDDTKGIKEIRESTSLPIIATNRRSDQGGYRIQQEDRRIQVLFNAADHGFDYIDLELTTPNLDNIVQELKNKGISIIISYHDFKSTPIKMELEKIIHLQKKAGADICKLITTANEFDDNLSCLFLTSKMSKKMKVVCFAMGEKGVFSRSLSPVFGGYFTYASVKKGLETAPGQLSISDLMKLYNNLGIKT